MQQPQLGCSKLLLQPDPTRTGREEPAPPGLLQGKGSTKSLLPPPFPFYGSGGGGGCQSGPFNPKQAEEEAT